MSNIDLSFLQKEIAGANLSTKELEPLVRLIRWLKRRKSGNITFHSDGNGKVVRFDTFVSERLS